MVIRKYVCQSMKRTHGTLFLSLYLVMRKKTERMCVHINTLWLLLLSFYVRECYPWWSTSISVKWVKCMMNATQLWEEQWNPLSNQTCGTILSIKLLYSYKRTFSPYYVNKTQNLCYLRVGKSRNSIFASQKMKCIYLLQRKHF